MSLPASPSPNAPVKQMSSRLLTMKFMQRAANTNTTPNKAQTPSSEPSFKRRKTEHTPDSSGPNTPTSEPRIFADRLDVKAALRAESEFEALAASRRVELGYANNTVETQWVLNTNIPVLQQQQQNGTSAVEPAAESSEDEEEDIWAESSGRQTYGSFKRKKHTPAKSPAANTTTANPDFDLSDASASNSDDNDDDEDEEGELSSDSDRNAKPKKKRKAAEGEINYDDERAMSALDQVDLSKSRYAKAKAAGLPYTGAKPASKKMQDSFRHKRDQRGENHPKKNSNNNSNNKKKKNKNKNKSKQKQG